MCIDSTGMGAPIYEDLYNEFGSRVEGIDFTAQAKEDMAMGIKIGLQRKEFILPNDKTLHNQIHSIRRIPTTGGHFRYDADRDENGHADSFWSFALANNAAGTHKKASYYEIYASRKKQIQLPTVEEVEIYGNKEKKGKSLNSVLRGFGIR